MSLTNEQLLSRIEELEQRCAKLEEETRAKTETILRELVTISATQIQQLFENDVMLTSIASNIVTSIQNALVFKASSSSNRKPVMMVIRDYAPKSMRVVYRENGELVVDQQAVDVVDPDGEWTPSPYLQNPDFLNAIRALLLSYGVEADETVYVLTDLDLDEHRQKLSEAIARQAQALDERASQVAE